MAKLNCSLSAVYANLEPNKHFLLLSMLKTVVLQNIFCENRDM